MILINLETELQYFKGITIPCQCEYCEKIFYARAASVRFYIKTGRIHETFIYCSKICVGLSKFNSIKLNCKFCGVEFLKFPSNIKKHEAINGLNYFCSKSCSTTYANTHKTKVYRRSKLEQWLEIRLTELYPNLEIHYCKNNTINSELDIYIPSLKLAFELNGIFHYEPIFGVEKLKQIQNNDDRKFQACLERGIEFCTIDSSKLKHFKPERGQKYLDIICDIINLNLPVSNNQIESCV